MSLCLGGGPASDFAISGNPTSIELHGSLEVAPARSRFSVGSFWEYCPGSNVGRVFQTGLYLYAVADVNQGGSTFYFGPHVGLTSMDLNGQSTRFGLGVGFRLNLPVSRRLDAFVMTRCTWGRRRDRDKTLNILGGVFGVCLHPGR